MQAQAHLASDHSCAEQLPALLSLRA